MASALTTVVSRIDTAIGDGVDAAVLAKHRRRLGRFGGGPPVRS
jgi:hypothetical protein